MKHKVFILMAVAIVCLVGWTTHSQTRASTSTTWEYLIVRSPRWDKDGEARLNQLGAQGWQFAWFRILFNQDEIILLKREK